MMLRSTGLKRPGHLAIGRSSHSFNVQNTAQASRRTFYLHSTSSRSSALPLRQRELSSSSIVKQNNASFFDSASLSVCQRRAFGQTVQPRNEELGEKQQETQDTTETLSAQPENGDVQGPSLTPDQQAVFNLVVNEGKNVFITGPAGAGKFFLLQKIIASLKEKHAAHPEAVAVTSDSKSSAVNIEGRTITGFSEFYNFDEYGQPEKLDKKRWEFINIILKDRDKSRRWEQTQVLIIDGLTEFSTKDFSKMENIARKVRGNKLPFGGIQVVISGDFLQLPSFTLPFKSQYWQKCMKHTFVLPDISRKSDPVFEEMLSELRENRLSPNSIEQFRNLSRPLSRRDGVEPVDIIYPNTLKRAEGGNLGRLSKLRGRARTYESRDWGDDEATRKQLLEGGDPASFVRKTLELKKGAQVVLIKDVKSPPLVSGSLGRVLGFMTEPEFKKNRATIESEWLSSGIPEDEIENVETAGSGNGEEKEYPVVYFPCRDGQKIVRLCTPEVWQVQEGTRTLAAREQVPLLLAWKLHRYIARLLTLDFVKTNLNLVSHSGDVYSILSCATHRDGLQVRNFDPEKVKVWPQVLELYRSLTSKPKPKEATAQTPQRRVVASSPKRRAAWMGRSKRAAY